MTWDFETLNAWWQRHLPTCAQVTRLVSESMDRQISLAERVKVLAHFLVCVWCRRYRDQLHLIRLNTLRYPVIVEKTEAALLSREARARILDSMKRIQM